MDKSGMDFPSCEGRVSVKRDFPRVQFDRKLGAELALGETIDIAKSLEKYLKHAGIPRDRWGD